METRVLRKYWSLFLRFSRARGKETGCWKSQILCTHTRRSTAISRARWLNVRQLCLCVCVCVCRLVETAGISEGRCVCLGLEATFRHRWYTENLRNVRFVFPLNLGFMLEQFSLRAYDRTRELTRFDALFHFRSVNSFLYRSFRRTFFLEIRDTFGRKLHDFWQFNWSFKRDFPDGSSRLEFVGNCRWFSPYYATSSKNGWRLILGKRKGTCY